MIPITIILFIFGAALGSFACCQAWRLRNQDKSQRSHCQNCDYRLKWFDNIPIISWLTLKGKCRKCGKKIGPTELLSEIGLGTAFALSYIFWPFPLSNGINWLDLAQFITFLTLLVGLTILFIYDFRWGELPIKPLIFCTICAIIFVILQQWSLLSIGNFSPNFLTDLLGALLILPILYLFLYKISNEQWVGSGDWILCIPLSLVLGNFYLSFLCLFTANLLGSLAVIPTLTRRKKKNSANKKIHFGPFLILAFYIVFLAQPLISEFLILV